MTAFDPAVLALSFRSASLLLVDFAPVVTTLTARGACPDSDRHNLGMPGMHGTVAAVGALQRADLHGDCGALRRGPLRGHRVALVVLSTIARRTLLVVGVCVFLCLLALLSRFF